MGAGECYYDDGKGGSLVITYLSGGIYKDNKEATEEWRKRATELLDGQVIDPCRGRAIYDPAIFTPEEIVSRDKLDIQRAGILLVYGNPVGNHLSIGTWMECEYAHSLSRPIVLVSTDPRVVNHPWLQRYRAKLFTTVDEACDYILAFWRD